MYGKIFESLFRGSMVGAGCPTFAVWSYVIAHMRPDDEVGAQVELNPTLLATIFGDEKDTISEVIEKLCQPDPHSTSKNDQGKRLIRLGEFSFKVVNGPAYMAIRNEEDRREYFRLKKRQQRLKSKPLAGEKEFEKAVASGDKGLEARTMHNHVTAVSDKLSEYAERQSKERQEKEEQIAFEAKNAEILAKREAMSAEAEAELERMREEQG